MEYLCNHNQSGMQLEVNICALDSKINQDETMNVIILTAGEKNGMFTYSKECIRN